MLPYNQQNKHKVQLSLRPNMILDPCEVFLSSWQSVCVCYLISRPTTFPSQVCDTCHGNILFPPKRAILSESWSSTKQPK